MLLIGVIAVAALTHMPTAGSSETLAPLDLTGDALVQSPSSWMMYSDAKREFRANWCRREFDHNACITSPDQETAFEEKSENRRATAR